MNVTCTRKPRIIVPDVGQDEIDYHRTVMGANIDEDSRQWIERAQLVGHGTDAVFVPPGCGKTFDLPIDDRETWDVNTDEDGNVIERHIAPTCPACGTVMDLLSEAVDA